MTIKKLLFNTSGWCKIEYWTTLEKDASVTDWQLNDMISFQKKLYLFHYHLSYKVSNSFLAVKMSVQIVFSKSKIFGDIDVVDKSR